MGLKEAIQNIWSSDYTQKNPTKAYKTSYAAEYDAVAKYLNGGAEPVWQDFSKLGKGLCEAEKHRRAEVPPSPPSGWTKVADEHQSFTLPAAAQARFGKNQTWVTKQLAAGTFVCNSGTFGSDPVPGTPKECQVGGTVVIPPPDPSEPPPTNWSGPINITSGGTYTGSWESTSGTSPVTISTSQPVIIKNSRIRSTTAKLISTPQTLNLTLEHVEAWGKKTPAQRLLDVDRWTAFTMRNCTIHDSAGCSFGFPGSPGATFLMTRNRHLNVQRATAQVNETHGQFIQIRDTVDANVEWSWNEVINEPELCWPEDVFSIINSANFKVHDNYVQHISAPGYQVSTQGAFTVEGSKNMELWGNAMVDVPAGMGFYSGSNNSGHDNRLIQDGYYPDSSHRIVEGWAGYYISKDSAGSVMNNNVSGYVNRDGQRLDWDPNSRYDLSTTNTTLPNPITRQMELDEWTRWQAKLAAAAVTVGV